MIAAIEALIVKRYTSAGRVVISGTSFGANIPGLVMVQRPDLLGAVLYEVGQPDEIRGSALDPTAATTWCARLAVDGPLDFGLLRQALEMLARRHLMLRVRILTAERPPRQQEDGDQPIPLEFADLVPAIAAGADETRLVDALWRAEQAQRFQPGRQQQRQPLQLFCG